jgi:hypothetical protein
MPQHKNHSLLKIDSQRHLHWIIDDVIKNKKILLFSRAVKKILQKNALFTGFSTKFSHNFPII